MSNSAINETIDDAEEIRDPLDDLVERCRADPSAPFAPDTLALGPCSSRFPPARPQVR
jgi:hypothetical protein